MKRGFSDPVLDSQAAFRALMEAMARPGRLHCIAALEDAPDGLDHAAAAALLTLADAETAIWTDAPAVARAWIGFHTGARFTEDPSQADFLLATQQPPRLEELKAGTDEAPQSSATLILQVEALAPVAGWRLHGPGIETHHELTAKGVPDGFSAAWRRNGDAFPRGVDLILTAGTTLAALPRTTRIEEAG